MNKSKVGSLLENLRRESRIEGTAPKDIYIRLSRKDRTLLICDAYAFIEQGKTLHSELDFLSGPVKIYRQHVNPSNLPECERKPSDEAASGDDKPRKPNYSMPKRFPRTSPLLSPQIQMQSKEIRRKITAIKACWKPARIDAQPGTANLIRILDEKDRMLAGLWAKQTDDKEYHEKHLAKMLSARVAEKGVIRFYLDKGHTVRDTSIQQVTGGEEWITYDLMVDDHIPIDVKNARTSVNSLSHYSEYIVPRLKQTERDMHDRTTSTEVRIVGVLSPYLRMEEFEYPKNSFDPELTVLGETCRSEIDKLCRQFSSKRLDLHILPEYDHRRRNENYAYIFPPWLFNYPRELYESFHKGLQGLDEIHPTQIPESVEFEDINVPIPFHIFLAAGRALPEQWEGALTPWQLNFYDLIRCNIEEFSLPFLFLNILQHFTEQMHDPAEEYHPNGYRELLFSDHTGGLKSASCRPLGIFDPLCTVHQLIKNLTTIWNVREKYNLDRVERYQFHGLGILRGCLPDTNYWTTVLAYCGGTLTKKRNAKCGKPDLILGANGVEVCTVCHRLICPECGYCQETCEKYKERRHRELEQDVL